MIQRIQTVFLFFSSMLMILFISSPLYIYQQDLILVLKPFALYIFDKDLTYSYFPYSSIGIIASVCFICNFSTIFLYNNRAIQIFFINIIIVLAVIILGLSIFFIYKIQSTLGSFDISQLEIGFLYLLMSFFSISSAKKYIKQDGNMVKSANRLR